MFDKFAYAWRFKRNRDGTRLEPDFELHLIDAIVEKLSPVECMDRVMSLSPQVIVGLIGSVSYE
ncbi:MAG: hypothetical protein ACE5GN_01710, partial [Waddliaceae bacterium]